MNRAKTANHHQKRVTFELAADREAEVFLAGTFNAWMPQKQRLSDKGGNGIYSCTLALTPGIYEYKFKVNDTWLVDVNNPNFAQNYLGSLNSVIVVQ